MELTLASAVVSGTHVSTDKLTNLRNDRQTDRLTSRRTDQQTDQPTDGMRHDLIQWLWRDRP